jgi:non-heme chloroperoxidase
MNQTVVTAGVSRRRLAGWLALASQGLVAGAAGMAAQPASAAPAKPKERKLNPQATPLHGSSYVTAKDGAQIFYKDWGIGRPIVFSHGWPLTADDWDPQMMFFGERGFRVIAHDRRGHGRSTQTWGGNDMDTYADDLRAVVEALDLREAIHVGHSTGGGEVARYLARYRGDRASMGVLMSAVPPVMLKSAGNPEGTPLEVFDGFRAAMLADRSQFYLDVPSGPFFGFNRPGAKVSQGLIEKWWLQAMMGGVKAQYDCIKVFSETDFTDDLKKIQLPMLVLHGEDDQVVPYRDAALKSVKLLKNASLKIYPGFPHGMGATNADQINQDILAFVRGQPVGSRPAAAASMS